MAMYIASLFDSTAPETRRLCRLATAVAKYHVCKRAPALAYEAMECMGGNGVHEGEGEGREREERKGRDREKRGLRDR